MKNYFKISDFNITGQPIPQDVADKIMIHHIIPLNRVREALGQPIIISQRSGYRPVWYEKKKNRPGTSQHCFLGMGAVDLTLIEFHRYKWDLVKHLVNQTEYSRITMYESKSFIHVDYAGINRFIYDENWERMFPAETLQSEWL
jgi:hypothetical protein